MQCNTKSDMSVQEAESDVVITVRMPGQLKAGMDRVISGRYSSISEFIRAKIREEVDREDGSPTVEPVSTEEDAA